MAKSFFDRLLSALGLAALSPVLAMVAAGIFLETGRPVFFRQIRIGRKGRPFHLLKFRSMRTDMKGTKITAGADRRVTRLGAFLRKYKLDELPQLWNVFKGDMSLVGPRPEIPEYVNLEDPCWHSILQSQPGITDLATLLYRNEEEILADAADPEAYYRERVLPAKMALNLEYIRTRTLWLDMKLILVTVYYSLLPGRFDSERARAVILGG